MVASDTLPEPENVSKQHAGILGLLWTFPTGSFTPLDRGSLTLGRGPECSVQVHGPRASRVHARIERQGPLHVVSDQGSRNGTWLNGARVSVAALKQNDVLRVGDSVALVLSLNPEVRLEQPFVTPLPGVLIGPRTRGSWERLVEVARTGLPVIFESPTGCGKEVFARALHALSGRSGPYVGVNCAALPDSLVEAQLFGHARGAFSGALQASAGLFETAHLGTLLLDEIVELPLSQQAKLLRALEEAAVTRLGEATPRAVDVRLACASQESLRVLVERGRFRADLLARLSGVSVELLPLAERREEIAPLFCLAYAAAGGDRTRLSGSFIEALCLASFPFNVRELAQVAGQAALLAARSTTLSSEQLPVVLERIRGRSRQVQAAPASRETESPSPPDVSLLLGARRAAWLARNRAYLNALRGILSRNGHNVAAAARSVGISHQRATRLLEAERQLGRRAGDRERERDD